ncbi:MAG TPA: GNAT family N-acetyltransferase [Acidobacteriaceae bacterium]|jgi:GNAT superfamily N-acetyltransferase
MPQLDEQSTGASPLPLAGKVQALDNPIWNALTTEQRHFALGTGLALRFPAEIGPLSGLAGQTDAAYDELRDLTGANGIAVLFLQTPPEPRPGWSLVRGGLMSQMIWSGGSTSCVAEPASNVALRRLTPDDVPSMVELAHLTEPGPFGRRTHELGKFFGIFEGERLLAMAGQRLHPTRLVEVSAVCTHPQARGRGYARALMSEVISAILQNSETPFLHVFADNYPAIRVYAALGFTWRRSLHLAVLKAV